MRTSLVSMANSAAHKDGVDFFILTLYHYHKRGGDMRPGAYLSYRIGWDRIGTDRIGLDRIG